jgi:xanthine dehydrogenase accessory factor
MSAGLQHLLARWYPRREELRWVLGTVYRTEGPSYRKAGAMMLFNDAGERFGLLSGGCLEADLGRHAQRLMQTGGARTVTYDTRDEGDVAYQLELGCGGAVHILLQLVGTGDDDLGLAAAAERVQAGEGGYLVLEVPDSRGANRGRMCGDDDALRAIGVEPPAQSSRARLDDRDGVRRLVVPFRPEPALLVVGGGLDARPLVAMAGELGWRVTVCDPRPAFARPRHFPAATHVHRGPIDGLGGQRFDAAVVMSHNLGVDADAMRWLCAHSQLRYLGLLGPAVRRQRVLDLAGVDEAAFGCPVSGPAGLDLGGELPADIALSIMAECQAVLKGRPAAAATVARARAAAQDTQAPEAAASRVLLRDVGGGGR